MWWIKGKGKLWVYLYMMGIPASQFQTSVIGVVIKWDDSDSIRMRHNSSWEVQACKYGEIGEYIELYYEDVLVGDLLYFLSFKIYTIFILALRQLLGWRLTDIRLFNFAFRIAAVSAHDVPIITLFLTTYKDPITAPCETLAYLGIVIIAVETVRVTTIWLLDSVHYSKRARASCRCRALFILHS